MWDVRSAHIPSSRTQGAPRVFPLGRYTPLVSMEDSFPFIAAMHLPDEVLNQDDLKEGKILIFQCCGSNVKYSLCPKI